MDRLKQVEGHLSGAAMDSPTLPDYIFFGHDTVNRFSFLREDQAFIGLALKSDSSRFVIVSGGAPLGLKDGAQKQLYYARYSELSPELDQWAQDNRNGAPLDGLRVTFLGMDESEQGVKYKNYSGRPYFGVDLTHAQATLDLLMKGSALELYKSREAIFELSNVDASMMSHAKMYLDWLERTRFCSGCGSKMLAIQAGTKLVCSSQETQRCPVKSASVSNSCFPRTDCVVITAVTTKDYSQVLVGRGKRFPGKMYSCIAGFMEPSETIEVASLREVWEETGVKGQQVEILKSQPWPYPANLMIGCIVFVEPNGVNEVIDLGHDPELVDAKWVPTEEIKRTLDGEQGDWFLPPSNAIAHTLIKHVVEQWDNKS